MVTTGGFGATYQWRKDGVNILGATNLTYTKTNTTVADSGNYFCVLSSFPCADKQSNPATVVVNPSPVASIAAVGAGTSICYDTATTIAFSGTPGAVVVYAINGGSNQSLTLSLTGVAINVSTGILIKDATYTLISVTTSGAAACPTTLTQSLTITVNPLPVTPMSDEGFICLEPITGTTFQNFMMETELDPVIYSFVWYKDNNIIVGATAENYEATTIGNYKVVITNIATGCKSTANVVIESSTPPQRITAEVTAFFADNSTIVVTATPSGDYEYRLDFGPYQNSNIFEMVEGGVHEISVRDKKECRTLVYNITVIDYPKFFTPNGDGYNDTWNISLLNAQPDARLFIFDRFGKLLKQISTTGAGWNGTFNGQELPADDYWFTLDYTEKGIQKVFKSHFSLKR